MKKKLAKIINTIAKPFGLQVVKRSHDLFTMEAALRRIVNHAVNIQTVIDIGASDGKWSMDAMRFFPEVRFLAIEPLKERGGALDAIRKQRANFDYELCVAGEHNDREALLCVADDLDGSTVGGTGEKQRTVPEKTIDRLISGRKLPGPYLLKFDTHGYELPILNGANQTLQETRIIIMEVYNFQLTPTSLRFHEMCAHLEHLGFRCYDMGDPMLRRHDKAFWQMDLFFCRKDDKMFACNNYS